MIMCCVHFLINFYYNCINNLNRSELLFIFFCKKYINDIGIENLCRCFRGAFIKKKDEFEIIRKHFERKTNNEIRKIENFP